jgi:tripartite-type tricarboxylate transporter receptor subunit TctC
VRWRQWFSSKIARPINCHAAQSRESGAPTLRDINELIAWLKANPNRASVGFQVPSSRLLTAFFQKETGTQLTLVPYRAGAMQHLVVGQIELFFANPDQLPLVRAGAIKAYAVTSEARLATAPDIPTFNEIGLPAVSYSIIFSSPAALQLRGRA